MGEKVVKISEILYTWFMDDPGGGGVSKIAKNPSAWFMDTYILNPMHVKPTRPNEYSAHPYRGLFINHVDSVLGFLPPPPSMEHFIKVLFIYNFHLLFFLYNSHF